jgi:hypothetical protein
MKKLLEEIRLFLVKAVTVYKKVVAFLKKWGLQLINLLVVIVAYDCFDTSRSALADLLVGLWLFALLAYYIFWKLLGAEKLFKKDE